MNKKEERNLKRFRHTPIVVLDTCVCRSLYNEGESPWFEDLKRIKDSGVSFCISDVTLTELEISFGCGSIDSAQWRIMMDRLNSIVSPLFPIIESCKQLFELSGITERKQRIPSFNYKDESVFSRNQFRTAFSYSSKEQIPYRLSDEEKELEKKRKETIGSHMFFLI